MMIVLIGLFLSVSFSLSAQTWEIGAVNRSDIVATFSPDSTLTISGTGPMQNFTLSRFPWYRLRFSIASVIIENGVTAIGNYAFSEMTNLSAVSIPNSVTKIGENAFESSSALNSIVIPNSVTSIGNSTFSGCTGLSKVTLPNSLTSIGSTVLVGGMIDSDNFGSGVFSNCTALTEIIIPNSVTVIGDYAFSRCDGLTNIIIPNSVTTIGWGAFEHCVGLNSIIIPNSVTTIGHLAFSNCTNLREIINHAVTPQPLDAQYVFSNIELNKLTLRVPAGSVYTYRNAHIWRFFGKIVSDDSSEILGREPILSDNPYLWERDTLFSVFPLNFPPTDGSVPKIYALQTTCKDGLVHVKNVTSEVWLVALNSPPGVNTHIIPGRLNVDSKGSISKTYRLGMLSADITFVATGAWNAETNVDWMSLEQKHGDKEGTYTIRLNMEQKEQVGSRIGTVKISCKETDINLTIQLM